MSEWVIKYTEMASGELDAIYRYIAYNLQAPGTAAGQVKRIMSAIEALGEMPLRNALYEREPWKSRGLRKLPVDNFMVFYFTIKYAHEVVIAHIFYGGRNIDEIIKDGAKKPGGGTGS